MATRSTIQIKSNFSYQPDITLYKHWDGYASNVIPLIDLAKTKINSDLSGSKYTAQLLANLIALDEGIEITTSHEDHDDTEYRYTIHSDKSIEIQTFDFGKNAWELITEEVA